MCEKLWGLFSAGDCKSLAIICRVAAVRFDSFSPHQIWSLRLSVRIAACHAAGTGSTPVGTAILKHIQFRPIVREIATSVEGLFKCVSIW